jgi:NDP-sugar pyrophosphorylase family protein
MVAGSILSLGFVQNRLATGFLDGKGEIFAIVGALKLQGVILAAGKGTRLGSLTKARSKAMQPILGIPIIERVLDGLLQTGIKDVIVVLHPKDTAAKSHLGKFNTLSSTVQIVEQQHQQGTAHALLQAGPHIKEPFILTFCDNIFRDEDLRGFMRVWREEQPLDGLLGLMKTTRTHISKSAAVHLEGEWVKTIVEKPVDWAGPQYFASIPLYSFSPSIVGLLDEVPASVRGERELQSAIQELILSGNKVKGFFISERLSLTKPEDLLVINKQFMHDLGVSILWAEQAKREDVRIVPPIYVDEGVTIGANCQIGPFVYIEKGCVIGRMSVIRDSIVLSGSELAPGSNVDQQVVHP